MEKITLKNGLRVLLEYQPYARTACFGVWVKSGSLYEKEENNGISHFIEHMVFKGTSMRSARRIAEEMDEIGGQMNAYTAKDYTCFYARTLEEHVEQGFSILADMVTGPRFDPHDVETEKGVVLEEIGMSDDTPEDKVVENQYAAVWRGSSAGMPILGRTGSLAVMDTAALRSYYQEKYTPRRMVVAICGRFERAAFLDCVKRYFGSLAPGIEPDEPETILYQKQCVVQTEEQEQTHICLCMPGLPAGHPKRYALNILHIIAGGSTSSRLFQRVREELGLAYSIFTDVTSYAGGGLFEIQTAVTPGADQKVCKEILHVLEGLRRGVTEKELARAREQLKSSVVMSMESSASRLGSMDKGELLRRRVRTEDELLAEIEAVTLDEVNRITKQVLDLNQLAVSVLGPECQRSFYHNLVCGESKRGR